jgi:hypothetical protein
MPELHAHLRASGFESSAPGLRHPPPGPPGGRPPGSDTIRGIILAVPVAWIEHRGTPILLFDYRGQRTSAELVATLEEGSRVMNAGGVPVPLLNDFTDAVVGSEFMERVKQVGRQNAALISRSALLGISGVKIVFVNAYLRATGERNTRAFETAAEALDFLVP